jgi:hypothetical protein
VREGGAATAAAAGEAFLVPPRGAIAKKGIGEGVEQAENRAKKFYMGNQELNDS